VCVYVCVRVCVCMFVFICTCVRAAAEPAAPAATAAAPAPAATAAAAAAGAWDLAAGLLGAGRCTGRSAVRATASRTSYTQPVLGTSTTYLRSDSRACDEMRWWCEVSEISSSNLCVRGPGRRTCSQCWAPPLHTHAGTAGRVTK